MKRYRIVSLLLIFVILLSSGAVFADTDETPNANENNNTVEAEERGKEAGKKAGEVDGKLDAKNESESDPSKNIDNKKILEQHLFGDESQEYKKVFLTAYIEAYTEAYNKAFQDQEQEKEEEKKEEEAGSSTIGGLGASLGRIHGEMDGIRDYENRTRSDWSRSIPSLFEMDRMFDLRKVPPLDRDNFVDQFTINYQLGYEDAYYNSHFGIEKANKENGRIDGANFGALLGKTFAIKDYHEGETLDYTRHMPSEPEIRSDYSLNTDNRDYSDGFINGFKNAFQESYANSFREAKNKIVLLEDSLAYENGNALGQAKGSIQANMDHMMKNSNDWNRSKPYTSTIMSEYNLTYQTIKYRDAFIGGFFDGYASAYNEVYKELSQEGALSKTTSQTVPISGDTLLSLDGNFAVEVHKGIYYKPVILTIDSLKDYSIDNRYISASNFYRLNVINPSGAYAKDKKIKIAFEYYGDQDGGIYQLEEGDWTYLTSSIEDGIISANVNPSTISGNGNVFAVLVDQETTIFHDIRGHWAKDEITAYIRRGVINGYDDNKFKPDQYITRAEFLILLSRLYGWYMPYDTSNNIYFKDYETFHEYNEKHISYSLTNGYIVGYPDKYFRPYNKISYKEVDLIMRRVLKKEDFKWEKYAEQMMYDKKTRSSSYDSYNNEITRAEFAYMLYKLNESKY